MRFFSTTVRLCCRAVSFYNNNNRTLITTLSIKKNTTSKNEMIEKKDFRFLKNAFVIVLFNVRVRDDGFIVMVMVVKVIEENQIKIKKEA